MALLSSTQNLTLHLNARILPRLLDEAPSSLHHQLVSLTWSVGRLYNAAHQLLTQQAAAVAAAMLPLPLAWAAPSPAALAAAAAAAAASGGSAGFGFGFGSEGVGRVVAAPPFPAAVQAEQDALLLQYKGLIERMEDAPEGVRVLLESISTELQGKLKVLPTRCANSHRSC